MLCYKTLGYTMECVVNLFVYIVSVTQILKHIEFFERTEPKLQTMIILTWHNHKSNVNITS